MKFTIARDEGGMTVLPDHDAVREYLTLSYREMEKIGGRTKFNTISAPLYTLTSVRGQAALFSYQGLWKSLEEHLTQLGHSVSVTDTRVQVLDPPNFAQALIGLREWQRPWIIKALMTGDSGLIGAPTRFGKSYGMASICRAFPKAKIVVTAPGIDLCRQLHEFLKENLKGRDVRGVFTGSRNQTQGEITVCSVDSLGKMDPDDTDILIGDEPHALVSEERLPLLAAFTRARKYGFGATLKGRFDRKDPLIMAIFGPVLANVTYKEAVGQGAISALKVIMMEIPFSKDVIPGRVERDVVYERLLTLSSRTAAVVKTIMHEVIPMDWQTMAFIQNEKQAEFYLEHAMPPEGTIAMAKRLTSKERVAMTAGIADGHIRRVLASNIYVQGVTFPDLRVVVNLAGGGANTTAIQKPGRLLQTRPNKNYGVMIDFIFKCRDAEMETRSSPPYNGIIGECWARYNAYRDIGYDIVMIDGKTENPREVMRNVIQGAYNQS